MNSCLERSAATEPTCRGVRVLVVDDLSVSGEVTQLMLQGAGFDAFRAESGAAALALLRREAVDVVLMDLQMPEMDGFAATRAIRASGSPSARAPVIALTALDAPEIVARCRHEGMAAHLTKPVEAARLIAQVEAALPAADRRPAATDQSWPAGMAVLRARFEATLPEQRDALRRVTDRASAEGWTGALRIAASNLCHALAGSAGMFGHPEISAAARAGERAAMAAGAPLDAALETLETVLTEA